MVAIIDYGMGNVASVQKALNFLKLESIITSDFKEIDSSEYIILPGVGSFFQGMQNLRNNGMDRFLTEQVIQKKKRFLGICLGMQLLAETSAEPYDNPGLGWVKGHVIKFENIPFRIPHMGWNNIDVKINSYYKDIPRKDFYFIHSYHFVPDNKAVIAATTNYGFEIVASIQQDNIFATQFHPEKSQEAGLSVLKTFFSNA
jgi:imidazole glycerol-phosphate synthase subunit HisH